MVPVCFYSVKLCGLFYEAFYIGLCRWPCVFNSFSIANTSPGKERLGLCAFRAFVCFASISVCLFPHPLGVRVLLRLVNVALFGLIFLSFCLVTLGQCPRLRAIYMLIIFI